MTGDKKRTAVRMANLAILVLHYGDLQEAEQLEREAMKIEVELRAKFYVGLYLTCLSCILAKQGNPQKAAVVPWASDSIFQTLGAKVQPADQIEKDDYLINIQEQLSKQQFNRAFKKGGP